MHIHNLLLIPNYNLSPQIYSAIYILTIDNLPLTPSFGGGIFIYIMHLISCPARNKLCHPRESGDPGIFSYEYCEYLCPRRIIPPYKFLTVFYFLFGKLCRINYTCFATIQT